ncbi:MAG: N-acetyltransferase [Gammaproteobacteria bacterium]|nr:N-acetyltransferase [Gammaproteobacteria bacterium]
MNIRLAAFDDLDEIVEIYNQAIAAGLKTADTTPFLSKNRLEWFKQYTPEKYPLLVAVENNELIIGYLTLSAYRPGRAALQHTVEVSFYIHFKHHRKGIASQLLEHAIELCPSLQVKTLVAILIQNNHGSIKLLEQYGFKLWGCMPEIVEFNGNKYNHLYYGLHINNTE